MGCYDFRLSGSAVINLNKYKTYERNLKRRKRGLEGYDLDDD